MVAGKARRYCDMEERRTRILALMAARIASSRASHVAGLVLVLSIYAVAAGSLHAADSPGAPARDNPGAASAAANMPSAKKDGEAAPSNSAALKESPLAKLPGGGYVLLPLTDAAQLTAGGKKEWTEALPPLVVSLLTSIAWPVAAVLITWWFLKTPQIQVFLTRASRRVTELSVAGLEIKLSEGATATLEDLQKLMGQIPDTHKDWVSYSRLGPKFQMVVSDIKNYLTTAACDSGKPLQTSDFALFRFTLHVPDVLLTHSFRQLVDYVGSQRGGAGRIFSMRIGIIGRAWRMERSEYVPSDIYTEDELIEKWGMTRAEAHDTTGGKKIHLAILIKSAQKLPLAVLYADATESKLFDSSRASVSGNNLSNDEIFKRLEKIVTDSSDSNGLTKSLGDLEDARAKVQQINLYEPRRA
jgi:hypothetical protein